MRVRHLPVGLVLPVLLVGLVVLLATLQYRWLGKVSEAEREQLKRSLEQRAHEFAADFDGEISRAYVSLQLSPEAVATRDWSGFAAAIDRWRSAARFPALFRAIYLSETAGDRQTLRRYAVDDRVFGPATDQWPSHLSSLRDQLAGSTKAPAIPPLPVGRAQFVVISVTPVASDIPALVVPISERLPAGDSAAGGPRLPRPVAYVVADIDAEYLGATALPTLVARHFPEQDSNRYRVAVVRGTGAPVYERRPPGAAPVDPARADVETPFFGLRIDVLREAFPDGAAVTIRTNERGAPGGTVAGSGKAEQRVAILMERRSSSSSGLGGAGAVAGRLQLLGSGWRLVLQHEAGSLDAAVSQVRRRNLWISFGILAVLAAGMTLIVVNAQRAARLAERQMDFVATVSHELRTPLAVIRSAAQNLSAGVVPDPARARRYGELIEDEGRRLTDMVEEILEYAGVRGRQPLREVRATDVGALVRDVAASCQSLCDRAGVTLDVSVEDDVPLVEADQAALRRALQNLLANALKHAADGRWIGVAVGCGAARGRRDVSIAVSDRGPGIAAADLGHVFEPFYRGRQAIERQVRGNGLGLSLVRHVAEAHGGSVVVKSAPGQGATFTLRLPAAVAPAGDPAGDPSRRPDQALEAPQRTT